MDNGHDISLYLDEFSSYFNIKGVRLENCVHLLPDILQFPVIAIKKKKMEKIVIQTPHPPSLHKNRDFHRDLKRYPVQKKPMKEHCGLTFFLDLSYLI